MQHPKFVLGSFTLRGDPYDFLGGVYIEPIVLKIIKTHNNNSLE